MIVPTTKSIDAKDLIQSLKTQFSNYSVYSFDTKFQKSIIVRKSAIVGAQLSIHDNEIVVDACYPNVFISAFMSLLTASTIFPFNAWHHFEKKITDFLKSSYS